MLVALVRYLWRRTLFQQALELGEDIDNRWAEQEIGQDEQYLYLQTQLANVLRSQGRYARRRAPSGQALLRPWQLAIILGENHVYTWITAGG